MPYLATFSHQGQLSCVHLTVFGCSFALCDSVKVGPKCSFLLHPKVQKKTGGGSFVWDIVKSAPYNVINSYAMKVMPNFL